MLIYPVSTNYFAGRLNDTIGARKADGRLAMGTGVLSGVFSF